METDQLVSETLGFALLMKASKDTAEEELKHMMQHKLRQIRREHRWTRDALAKAGAREKSCAFTPKKDVQFVRQGTTAVCVVESDSDVEPYNFVHATPAVPGATAKRARVAANDAAASLDTASVSGEAFKAVMQHEAT